MEPDGDPEARIRDLERPLTDQAQSSELGTRPYETTPSANTPVPPYPYGPQPDPYGSPPYGSPYYSPPQRVVHKRPQPALWLIPLVVVGVIGIGIAALVTYVNLGGSGTGSPVRPTSPEIEGGGPLTPTDDLVTVGAGDTLSFGGIEQNKTVVCNQGTVNISGVTNTIEIQGDCAAVSVSGMDNIITVESAQTITASGVDNKVTYLEGAPEVSKSGSGNVIEQG